MTIWETKVRKTGESYIEWSYPYANATSTALEQYEINDKFN